jgi:hypothetical protein
MPFLEEACWLVSSTIDYKHAGFISVCLQARWLGQKKTRLLFITMCRDDPVPHLELALEGKWGPGVAVQ